MKRALVLAAIFASGLVAAFIHAPHATADTLSCSTDTAAAVAAGTATNLGLNWSSPANPDPLWDVELPAFNMSLSVYAPDAAGARAKAKQSLDTQVAALGCVTTTATTTTAATTTQASTTATETVTTTETTTTQAPPVVYLVPTPGATETVTAPAPVATAQPPVSVVVNVTFPIAPITVDLSHAACAFHGKRVACSRLATGAPLRLVAVWVGKTMVVRTANGG